MEAYALPEKGHYFRMDKNNSYFIQNGNVFAHEYIFCQSVPLHCFRHSHLTAAHRQDRLLKKFVQFPAQPFSSFGNHFSGTARRKFLILKFLFQALHFQIRGALRRTHQRAGPD